jgi:hypothetical protein
MKIDKFLKSIEKLFFNTKNNEEEQKELRDKLLFKIEETRKEIKTSSNEDEIKDLKDKLSILKKLLDRL